MMATYYHGGAEIQAAAAGDNNLQTLYLMNPNFIASAGAAYSEGHHHTQSPPPNMLLLNPTATPNTLNQGNTTISHHSPHQQLIGIPLSGPHSSDPSRPSDNHHHHQQQQMNPAAMHGLAVSRVHYNLWSPSNDASPSQPGPINELGHMGFRRPVSAAAQGGLSLSLSPGQHQQNQNHHHLDDMRMVVTVASGTPMTGNGVIMGSKYLKAAQELLEEVANVSGVDNHNSLTGESSGVHKDKAKAVVKDDDDSDNQGGGGGESSIKAAELSTPQRQELQMKKAKLLSMLDEVEQRYRQYHTRMQVVVSSFEHAAGFGSAKLYTSLALKTISKQFRCLKDAITSQIKASNKSLGEEDNGAGGKLEGGTGSRLRFVDHQLRQQRALQQLGMIQHNAWRPQRGLPERAVSVLRAWLFEHFLHPYPKDSDKHLLAKQTGLTRSQVSNWFINARVRLWKPMVEEMYVEEMKGQEQNGGTSEDHTNNNGIGTSSRNEHNNKGNSTNNNKTNYAPQHEQEGANDIIIQTHHHHQQQDNKQTTNDMISNLSAMSTTSSQGFTLIGSTSDMESLIVRSPKKQRSSANSDMNSPSSILSMDMEMKPLDQQHQINRDLFHQRHHHSSLMSSHGEAAAGGLINPYLVNDIGRFNPDQLTQHHYGNAVALTLGLPHCENLSLSGNHQHNFMTNNQGMPQLGRRLEIGSGEADFCGISMGQPSHPSNGYESIDIQSRKRFATHQILHDFVA